MTRTVVSCDRCGREIPPTAPRWRVESRMRAPSVEADVCSSECAVELLRAVEREAEG